VLTSILRARERMRLGGVGAMIIRANFS
jgi:hypothetical protein